MKELARQIQQNPEKVNELLDSYKTDSKEVRDFLESLKKVVVYVVPALIETFAIKHRRFDEPKRLVDLTLSKSYLGCLFLDENEVMWKYVGVNPQGLPCCIREDSMVVHELPQSTPIKWLF